MFSNDIQSNRFFLNILLYIDERDENNEFNNNRGYDTSECQVKLINWRRCERRQGGAIVQEK